MACVPNVPRPGTIPPETALERESREQQLAQWKALLGITPHPTRATAVAHPTLPWGYAEVTAPDAVPRPTPEPVQQRDAPHVSFSLGKMAAANKRRRLQTVPPKVSATVSMSD